MIFSKRKYNKKQIGMTVIEMLMAVTLFAVSSALISSFIIYGYKNHLKVTEEALATDRVNTNIQNMVEELREARIGDNGAYPIESALSNQVIFYSDIDRDEAAEKISYFIDAGELYKGVINPSGEPPQYSGESEELTKISEGIENDANFPMIHYWGIDPEGGGNNIELEYPIDISRIRLIEVSLITKVGDTDKERIVSSKVLLRNLRN